MITKLESAARHVTMPLFEPSVAMATAVDDWGFGNGRAGYVDGEWERWMGGTKLGRLECAKGRDALAGMLTTKKGVLF